MTSGFNNSIIGGQQNLIRPSIRSPNYVAGVSGWTINKDGSCEFNSGTFRGTIVAGQFQGTKFIINNSGMFFYSGTPALGNLIIALAPASGTDSFGNAYIGGLRIIGGASGNALLDFPTKATHENRTMQIYSVPVVPHAGAQFAQSGIVGPSMNVVGTRDYVEIQWNSADDDNTSTANMQFYYYDDGGTRHRWAYMDNTGFNITQGSVPGGGGGATPNFSFSDFTNRTVTAASQTQLSSTFAFAANDNTATTIYEYEAWGNGTWGSTQQQLNYGFRISNVAQGGTQGIAATTFNASAAFNWHCRAKFYGLPVNSAGTCKAHFMAGLSNNTAAGQTDVYIHRSLSAMSIDTSAAFAFDMTCAWAATTGAPTITCLGSQLVRKGT